MKDIQTLRTAFASRKMGSLLLLGFASGLPLLLTSKTLQVWMQSAKVDIGTITLFGILSLPYSLKFLWSPLLDRFLPPFLGARRGWLAITQLGLAIAIGFMAIQQPSQNEQTLQVLAITCLIVTFFSATQDIAGDAYRTDVLNPLELEAGASVWVLGYRGAVFVASSLVLVLADEKNSWHLSWNLIYGLMAVLMGLGVFVTIAAPREAEVNSQENNTALSAKDILFLGLITLVVIGLIAGVFLKKIPLINFYFILAALIISWIAASLLLPLQLPAEEAEIHTPGNLQEAIFLPFKEFYHRSGIVQASIVLVFIIVYKLGDSLVGITANLFLLSLDFSKTEIGALQAGMGFLATTVGVLAGGVFMAKFGIFRSLWIFGVLQLLSNLGYYVLSLTGKNYSVLVLAVNIENFCAGLVTVVMVAYLMSLCQRPFTTTQFALFSSLMAIGRDVLAAPAGELQKLTGWSTFFLLSLIVAVPGLLLLPFVAPWNKDVKPLNRPGLE